MNRTVYITGATGSIGGALARRLSNEGSRLRLLVRDAKKASTLQVLPGVEMVYGDIRDAQSIKGTLDGCEVVFHCAAKIQGSNLDEYQRINIAGTEALAKEAVCAKVARFVYVSTTAVYGYQGEQSISEEHAWSEHSRSPYIRTKQAAEKALRRVSDNSGLNISIARPGDVFGPGQFGWTIQFIQLLKRGALHPPTASSSGMANLVYIDSLLDALLLLAKHPAAVGQAFNVVDQSVSFHDYIVALARMAGVPAFPIPGVLLYGVAALLQVVGSLGGREAKINRDSASFLLHKDTFSKQKLRSVLGWTPRVSLEEAYRLTETWLRAHSLI
jgi:nucleoside-diphosphate-sugar epimerase